MTVRCVTVRLEIVVAGSGCVGGGAGTDRSVCATGEPEQSGDVFACLVFPVGAVVGALGALVVEGVADTFVGERVKPGGKIQTVKSGRIGRGLN